MRRKRGVSAVLLLALVVPGLVACSVRMTSRERFPEADVLLGVAPYEQEPLMCGPYALAAVLNYLGIKADPLEVAGAAYSPGAGGTLTMDLYLESRRRGAESRQVEGTGETLREELEKGFPAIVILRYPGLRRSTGHFVVVNGFSSGLPGFFLLWGDGKVSWMEEGKFMDFWSAATFWALYFSGEERS